MVTAQSLGLVSEEVNRIRSFLLDRATAHDEENTFGDPLHRLCAATLRRDAAATSIILEDYSDAAALLRQAGHGFVAATSLYGLTLLSVTDEAPPWHLFEGRTATLDRQFRYALQGSIEDGEAASEPVSAMEAISALQALSVQRKRDNSMDALRRLLISSFQAFPSPGGPAELRTPSYFRVLSQAASVDDIIGKDFATRDLVALATVRDAELNAARADEYHWPLLLSPSDVVGFDLMIVGLAAIRNDQPLEPMLEAFGDLDSPTALPLKAALKLDASIA